LNNSETLANTTIIH